MKCNKRQQQQLTASDPIQPNKHQRVLETIVKNATQMWCSNPIHLRNPLQFLQLSSHCINDTFMEASQVQLTMESSETHANSGAAAANDNTGGDVDYEHSFNLLKSNLANRKTKSSTIKKTNTDSNHMNATTHMVESVNLHQINSNNYVHIESMSAKSSIVTSNSQFDGNEINFNKSEPPPLAFYPKNRGNIIQTPIIFSATEPPPLVPIARFNFT